MEREAKMQNKAINDYVVFDLETTGLSRDDDKIIEIAAIRVIGGAVDAEFSTLVNPGMTIPEIAEDITGISNDMVKDAPSIKEALTGFLDFAGDMVLIGHNIRNFDLKFLYRESMDLFGKTFSNDYIDTLKLSCICLPELSDHTLGYLSTYYGISTNGAHRALNDCRMTQQVYENLKEEMEHPSEATKTLRRCPLCGSLLKKRKSVYGEFLGCDGFPGCKYTEKV